MPIFTATLWIVVSAIFAGGCSSDPVSNVEQQVSNAEREMVHQTLLSQQHFLLEDLLQMKKYSVVHLM